MTNRWMVVLCSGLWLSACSNERDPSGSEVPQAGAEAAGALQIASTPAGESASPLSLTASDGSGLRLAELKVRSVVEPPLAFTELHLSFDNPEDRVREGRFQITLPDGAAISRFAMKIGGRWQEGEVVEKQKARRVYEDFLHRKQDPALMESDGGNQFRARVFPIPAHARKELIVAYSQALDGLGDYRVPLSGLPRIDRFEASVSVGGPDGPRRVERELLNSEVGDLTVKADRSAVGLRNGPVVVARVFPTLPLPPAPVRALTVLLDTSASRSLGFESQLVHLQSLVSELGRAQPDMVLRVLCFDQDVEAVFDGPARDFGKQALAKIRQRSALGASDLSAALTHLAAHPRWTRGRLLLISDGVITAGEHEAVELRAAVRRLKPGGLTRMDALVVGGLRDSRLLRQLVSAELPQAGVVLDGSADAATLARRMGQATLASVEVKVPGAKWVWPATVEGLQSGDPVVVHAYLEDDRPLQIDLPGTRVQAPTVRSAAAPLVDRSAARAEVDRLAFLRDRSEDGAERERLRAKIIETAVRYRVLSEYTALLVLETEQDYRRYDIGRKGLADILQVGDGGLQVVQRQWNQLPWKTAQAAAEPRRERTRTRARNKRDRRADDAPMAAAPAERVAEEDAEAEEAKAEAEPDADEAFAGGAADEGGGGAPPAIEGPADGRDPWRARTGAQQAAAAAPPPPSPRPAAAPAPSMPAPEPPGVDELTTDLAESANGPTDAIATGSGSRAGRGAPATRAQRARRRPGRVARRPRRPRPMRPEPAPRPATPPSVQRPPEMNGEAPWTGSYAIVMQALRDDKAAHALAVARDMYTRAPSDVIALLALGDALAANEQPARAARAFGSLIDLFPSRADLRRMAGQRLERLRDHGLALAIDTFRRAVEQRPDHPSGHRLFAIALLKAGRYEQAFEALRAALGRSYHGRFANVHDILRDDLSLVAAAWRKADPKRQAEIRSALRSLGAREETRPTLRFVLHWETDANDVDFHVVDGQGGHAYYRNPQLPSGGRLYADLTGGYGPESFRIDRPQAFPYRLFAHYYSRGPMGYGMGSVHIIEHDGKGSVRFEERPFVVMRDRAYVELGEVVGPNGKKAKLARRFEPTEL